MTARRAFGIALLASAVSLPAQLAGTYVVGPAGTFANMAAAIAALTTQGVVAPVTFLVTANDVGPWTIPSFPGQGPANPVLFDAQGAISLGGAQPVLTLNGCAAVTFRGFVGTFSNTTSSFVIDGVTSECVFTGCDFQANVLTSGQALFSLPGGSDCRIEDCTFGGSFEALNAAMANTRTTVQRCRILGGGWWIMRIAGSDFSLVDNLITGSSNYGISCGISGQPTSAANLKVSHNSIYIAHTTAGTQYCSLRWYSNAAGTEVQNNVLFDNYPTPPSSTTSVFNMWCSGAYRPATMNFNCFWSNQPATFPVYASANRTLAAWQGLGFDLNSIQADPNYLAPAAVPADLRLQAGSPCATAGTFLPSVLTDYFLAPRTPAVSIGAHEEDSGASYAVFGGGCVGTAGTASNTASAAPRIGQSSTMTFGNLPAPFLAVAILGVSNATSGFGPLPLDLTFLGAPGCFLRVSLDATLALQGASGSASLLFPVPPAPGLVGFTFHTQAAVLDPALNAFGMSTSDAATAIVGN